MRRHSREARSHTVRQRRSLRSAFATAAPLQGSQDRDVHHFGMRAQRRLQRASSEGSSLHRQGKRRLRRGSNRARVPSDTVPCRASRGLEAKTVRISAPSAMAPR
ncbi:hypothetical protein MTO96_031195 [Rhipicephalus appendiculatus]